MNNDQYDHIHVDHLCRVLPTMLVLSIANSFNAEKQASRAAITNLVGHGIAQADADAAIATAQATTLMYERFKQLALALDPEVERFAPWREALRPAPAPRQALAPGPSSAPIYHDPMDVDVDRIRSSRRCYNCNRLGHISHDCRAPRRTNNNCPPAPRPQQQQYQQRNRNPVVRAVLDSMSLQELKDFVQRKEDEVIGIIEADGNPQGPGFGNPL